MKKKSIVVVFALIAAMIFSNIAVYASELSPVQTQETAADTADIDYDANEAVDLDEETTEESGEEAVEEETSTVTEEETEEETEETEEETAEAPKEELEEENPVSEPIEIPKATTVKVKLSGSSAVLTWDQIDGVEGYSIYRKHDNEKWTRLKSVSTETYTDKTPLAGIEYEYLVLGYYYLDGVKITGETGDHSTVQFLICTAPNLKTPTSLEKGLSVKWDPVYGAAKYRVSRKTAGGSWTVLGYTTDTEFRDLSARTGVVYYYTVCAYSEGKIRGKQSTNKVGIYLPATKVSQVSNTTYGVSVTWDLVSKATSYRIYRRLSGTTKWTKLKDVKGVLTYLDQSAVSGKTYEYMVLPNKAVEGINHFGSWTQDGIAKIIRLEEPVLTKSDTVLDGVQLAWNKVNGASRYRLYRKSSPRGKWIYLTTVTGTEYVDTTAEPGVSYFYTLSAQCGTTRSSYGESTIAGCYLKPIASLTLTNKLNTIRVSWKAVAGAESYRVYKRRSGTTRWTRITDTTACAYTDAAFESGTTYEYLVRAMKKQNGKILFSAIAVTNNMGIVRLETPRINVELTDTNGAHLSWNEIAGATSYEIYRKTKGESWVKIKTTKLTEYTISKIPDGIEYYFTVKAISGNSSSSFLASKAVKIPCDLDLPETRYIYLGWRVDPRATGGPAVYGSTTDAVDTRYWTLHNTYGGDKYKPQAGDIITYGEPDAYGNTQGHVDICVSSYDPETGCFGVISGNNGSYWATSPIEFQYKNWTTYTRKSYYRTICNIWECNLSERKRNALIDSAYKLLYAYEEQPDYVRNKILGAMRNPTNWCDVFVAYAIFIAQL